jgi:thiol-disulfide isomerase/thioredoxin
MLDILKEFGSVGTFQPEKSLKTTAKAGYFYYKIENVSKPFFISMRNLGSFREWSYSWHSLEQFLVEPGDSIYINFDDQKKLTTFSGRGSAKFKWANDAYHYNQRFNIMPPSAYYSYNSLFPELSLITTYNQATLENLRDELSPAAYAILRAQTLKRVNSTYSTLISHRFGEVVENTAIFNSWIKSYEDQLLNYPIDTTQSFLKSYSNVYSLLMVNKAKSRFIYNKIKNLPNPKDDYTLLKNSYPKGILRDKAITAYLFIAIANNKKLDSLLKDAITEVSHPPYRHKLVELQNAFGIGMPVKDFDFKDINGNTVKLRDFRGKFVLVDMWFTGCSGCIDVAKGLPAVEYAFKGNPDVQFVSLCVDRRAETWHKSIDPRDPHGKSYTHHTTATTKYLYVGDGGNHPFIERYNPNQSYPKLLLIDKDGKMYSSTPTHPVNEKSQKSLITEIKKALL